MPKFPNEIVPPDEGAFKKCGVRLNQNVTCDGIKGVVKGIVRKADGLYVMVAHKPSDLPPETIPVTRDWTLRYYRPQDVKGV